MNDKDGYYREKLLKRETYFHPLTKVDFFGNGLIKVLTGQRRSGKSFLMRQLIFHLHNQGINHHNNW